MKKLFLALILTATWPGSVSAFCGFFVAKADTRLFNSSSRVVLARHNDRTVVTMENDYRGDPREFAMVVPVPTVLSRGQIHVGETKVLDHLDAYTAPRLVEYHDPDPCEVERRMRRSLDAVSESLALPASAKLGRASGVTVEARYSVGEYDVVILSATESNGLEGWLRANGYRLPPAAGRILGSYIRQGLHFFVAKVNLERHQGLGRSTLRPLQIAYESSRFMLPIRLGTLNADGPQELFVFTLTRAGRVEPVNYRTAKLPTGMNIPVFIKNDFASFYRDMFDRQVKTEGMRPVFLEYAWDMAWCDPCAADPLSAEELRELGVFWADTPSQSGAQNVFVTRMHLRYDATTFPQDLVLHETADRTNFQGRYALQHPWQGESRCAASETYLAQLPARWDREALTLAELTGWTLEEINRRMDRKVLAAQPSPTWWQRLWKQ